MKKAICLLILCFMVILSGCCESRKKEQIAPVSVDIAMESLARGFVKMKKELKNQKTGLVASEAEVVFNIAHASTESGTFMVELTPPPNLPVGGKVGIDKTAEQVNKSGNTITIKFKSLLFDKTTTITEKSKTTVIVEGTTEPNRLVQLYDVLEIIDLAPKK